MGFIVFVLTAILTGAIFENFGAALFLGFISYLLFKQSKRIAILEERLYGKPIPQPESPQPETAKVQAAPQAESVPKKEPPSQAQEIKPAISRPISEPSPIVAAKSPSASFYEILEGIVGTSAANFLLRGNPIARIGSVVLLIGVVFLLKLAADQGFFPPEFRLMGAALLSIALMVIGWRVRKTRDQFSLILQGTGAGVFYITAFLAFRIYHFIPGPLAFAFLVAITFISGWLSLLQNSKALALMGLIGGFLAPLLTSEGGGSHIALFGYIAILNLGVFWLCWFKAWRAINLTAFVFTFLIASSWAAKFYTYEFYLSCQLFLIFFAILYGVINALYSINERKDGAGVVDTLMTFGAPIFVFSLQLPLVKNFEYGSAISSALYGSLYIVLASVVFSKHKWALKFLVESYLLIGLVLISLAVPFAFSSQLSSAIWALEASALIWSGIRQSRYSIRILGLLLLVGASIMFLGDPGAHYGDLSFRNNYFLGILLLTAGHFIAGALLVRAKNVSVEERQIGPISLIFSIFWWALGAGYEVTRHIRVWYESLYLTFSDPAFLQYGTFSISVVSIFGTLSILVFWILFGRYELPGKRLIRQCLIPLHLVILFWFFAELTSQYTYGRDAHLFSIFGIISWPLFFGVHYWILWRDERGGAPTETPMQHTFGLWTAIAVLTFEAGWILERILNAAPEWRQAAWIAIPAFFAIRTLFQAKNPIAWPILNNSDVYKRGLWLPVWWSFAVSFYLDLISPASAYPLPYFPFLNPLDLAQGVSFIAALLWLKASSEPSKERPAANALLLWSIGPWLFVWATSTLIRVFHHFFGIRWNFDAIFDSQLVQASLSIFWSVLALALMVQAHRKRWRVIWQAGAVLVGVVVIKLFLVDLSSQGTVARIAAFLGVGLLLLVIGYLAPIPPDKEKTNEEKLKEKNG